MYCDASFQLLMAGFVHVVILWDLTTCSWQINRGVSKDLAVSFLGLKKLSPETGYLIPSTI